RFSSTRSSPRPSAAATTGHRSGIRENSDFLRATRRNSHEFRYGNSVWHSAVCELGLQKTVVVGRRPCMLTLTPPAVRAHVPCREFLVTNVPDGSSVLDVGCG